jgi:hypothetical protein
MGARRSYASLVIPDIATIVADPGALVGLSRATLADLRYQAALLVAACDREMAKAEGAREWDRLVNAQEIAERMGRSVEYVYAHAAEWPFTVAEDGKHPRFSLRRFEQWIERESSRRTA